MAKHGKKWLKLAKKWLKLGVIFWAQISICVKKLTFRNSAHPIALQQQNEINLVKYPAEGLFGAIQLYSYIYSYIYEINEISSGGFVWSLARKAANSGFQDSAASNTTNSSDILIRLGPLYIVYSIQYIVYSIQYMVYSIQYIVYSIQYIVIQF